MVRLTIRNAMLANPSVLVANHPEWRPTNLQFYETPGRDLGRDCASWAYRDIRRLAKSSRRILADHTVERRRSRETAWRVRACVSGRRVTLSRKSASGPHPLRQFCERAASGGIKPHHWGSTTSHTITPSDAHNAWGVPLMISPSSN